MFEYDLTQANRLVLNQAFGGVRRVDIGIDAVIEDHAGEAFVDNLEDPKAFKIQILPFCYFAGDFGGKAAVEMIRQFRPYHLLMAYPDEVIDIARECFGNRLIKFPRYSFSSDSICAERINTFLDSSPHRSRIVPLDSEILSQVAGQPDHFLDILVFESAEDFLKRGFGYALTHGNTLAGVAYSSLVSNAAIEVSVYVEPDYRRKGIATALGCALIRECLSRNIDPHWDAANVESCTLAEKLGYTAIGIYDAYYVCPEKADK